MKNILCFGDSNTWGYDISTYDEATGAAERMDYAVRWPGAMARLLGDGYRVIEDALNARTQLVDDPYFLHRQGMRALEVALDAHAPLDAVLLHLGVNDLKHMFNLTPGMIALAAEQLARRAQTRYYGYPAPKVLLICPPPVRPEIGNMLFGFSYGPDAYEKSLALAGEYEIAARRAGCAFLDAGKLGFELNDIDGLHYAKADHLKLASAAAEAVRRLI